MTATRRARKLVSLIAAGTVLLVTGVAFAIDRDGRTRAPADMDVYVKRGERVWRHRKGDPLLPRDTVRVVPRAPGYSYFMVLWQGESGEVELICPWRRERSEALPPPGEPARGAAVLDDQLGPEAFVALFSHKPLRAVDVVA